MLKNSKLYALLEITRGSYETAPIRDGLFLGIAIVTQILMSSGLVWAII